MGFIYLAPYEYSTDGAFPHWRPPGGDHLAAIDLRSTSQMAAKGGVPGGFGVFEYSRQKPELSLLLGNSWDSAFDPVMAGNAMGLPAGPIDAADIKDLLWELLTTYSDPTGEAFCKPLRPSSTGSRGNELRLSLGKGAGRVGRVERFDIKNHPNRQKVIQGIQHDYRLLALEQGVNLNTRQKYLGYLAQQYAVDDHTIFIPSDMPDIGRLPPTTTLLESFDKADGALGPDLAWTSIAGDLGVTSNKMTHSNTSGQKHARAESDLSSSDNYAQIVLNTQPSTQYFSTGVMARQSASALTGYFSFIQDPDGGGADLWLSYKVVAGSYTAIGTNTSGVALVNGDVLRIEANGSDIARFKNGSSQDAVVDTSITGNLRSGIYGYNINASSASTSDSFESGDLAVGGGGGLSIPIAAYHYNHHLGSMSN